MAGGANGGAGTEGKAFNAGPVGVNLADPQGTEEGLDQAREAQNAFNAAIKDAVSEAQIAAQTLGGWISPTNAINALTGNPMDTLELAMENAKTQQAIEDSYSIFDYSGPAIPNPMDNNPGYNYQDPAFDETLSGFPHTGSGTLIGGFTVDPNYNPGVSLIDPVDTTPSTNPGTNAILDAFGIENQSPTDQQEVDALMDNVLGMQSNDGMNLDNALSWNNRVSPKVLNVNPSTQDMIDWNPGLFQPDLEFRTFDKFDPENLKQNFFNNPQKMFDDIEESFNMSEVNPAIDSNLSGVEGFMEAGGVLGGGSGVIGPDFDARAISEAGGEALQQALAQRAVENILSQQAPREMINVTPPAPPKVAPQRRAAPKPSPIQIAAKAITKPEAVKKLPKFAQESLRQGKVPTGLNSRNQDLVDRVLATPKVDIMSAGVNVKGNRALQKARARAAQNAK